MKSCKCKKLQFEWFPPKDIVTVTASKHKISSQDIRVSTILSKHEMPCTDCTFNRRQKFFQDARQDLSGFCNLLVFII